MTTPTVFTVRVRDSGGAYATSTIQGKRASSTSSARQAVQSLAHKLIPDRPFTLIEEEHPATFPASVTLWSIVA